MQSNYKPIGNYIKQIKIKNTDSNLTVEHLRGIRINKEFMPSVANVTGTDLSKYRIVEKNQFAYNPMHVGRDEVLPISMLTDVDKIIVSPAYVIFEVTDINELLPEYLMIWCRRSEFDRNAWFTTDSSVRGGFNWNDFCDLELPIPSIEKQKEIVKEYHTITDRIKLNEHLIQTLEDTAQSIYQEWFVNFDFPDKTGKPYKSDGGKMVYCDELDMEIPILWKSVNLDELLEIKYGKDYKHLQNGEIPLYGSGGIMKYVNEALYDKESILIPRKGSLNNIIYINNPFWSIDTMFYSKSRKEYFIKYLFHILNKIDFYNLDVGSAVPSMTTSILNNMKILKPIDSIVIQFDNYLVVIFKHMDILVNETKKLVKLKEILLSKMATTN